MSVSPQTLQNNDSNAIWASASSYTYKNDITINNELHHIYGRDPNNAFHDIKVNTVTDVWSDSGNDHPETVNDVGVFTLVNGNVILKYPNEASSTILYSFAKPTTASWISSGPTVTQTRTTHTGIIPNATGFTIRGPSPGVFYEKTGVSRFKIKFLDLNTPTTYDLKVIYTTADGVHGEIQTIPSGTGDIALEYEGTSSSDTPVNGTITAQIVGHTMTYNGIQYSPGTVFKTFTYYETGPYTASFSPDFGLPGQSITVSIADTNPYPDSDTPTQFEQAPGTDLISMPLNAANNYSNTVTSAFTSQHGQYKIYNGSTVLATANYDTTSNGGGKPDRYPLIMTNLFNRNRSIYSIGMTHKDTWDLFL